LAVRVTALSDVAGAANFLLSPYLVPAPERRAVSSPTHRNTNASYAGHQNLTMPMQMRRFTRLTNAFSKKVENHAHAVALHFMYYNFVRIDKTLRMTPAMAAKVTDRLWEVADIVKVLEDYETTR
jgi:hypothetical protein